MDNETNGLSVGGKDDLRRLTRDQLLGLMEESINRSLFNFYGAMESMTEHENRLLLQEIIRQMQELRLQITGLFGKFYRGDC